MFTYLLLSTATASDLLQVDTVLAATLNIQIVFNSSGIVISGPASPDDYRQVLATITYTNTAEEPVPPGETAQRTVSFSVFDGNVLFIIILGYYNTTSKE